MTVMIRTLWEATGSFGLQSADAMAHKAYREYVRARDTMDDDTRRDAVLNCAMSVWHVSDWAWSGMADLGRDRPEFAQFLGVSGRRPAKDDLVTWALRTCPELEICQSICNGSKHVRADRPTR